MLHGQKIFLCDIKYTKNKKASNKCLNEVYFILCTDLCIMGHF